MDESLRQGRANATNRQGLPPQEVKPRFLSRPFSDSDKLFEALSLIVHLSAVGGAISMWIIALRGFDLGKLDDLGLVSVFPDTFYFALMLLTVSFAFAASRKKPNTALLLLHIVVLIVIIHGTPAIIYGTLRYSWAWKHLGIIDYIQRHGGVNPAVNYLSAYHGWPGFFALNAVMTEVAGLKNPVTIASWAPVFFNIVNLGALLMIMRTLTRDQRLVWGGIWFFYITSWVGQDYYSPQAMGYFLYLVALGIFLRWFKVLPLPSKASIKRFLLFNWTASLFHKILSLSAAEDPSKSEGTPPQRAALLAMAIVFLIVITFSHQLTPLIAIFGITSLVIFQRFSARSMPILMGLMMAAWLFFGATVFVEENVNGVIRSFGLLLDNVDSNFIDLGEASEGQATVALITRMLSVSVLGLSMLGILRRIFSGSWDLSAMLLLFAPFAMLVVNSYGGEMLFRVYLFALPFMAFFIGALIFPNIRSGLYPVTAIMMVALSAALVAGFIFAYYGKERQYYFTPNEVAAARYLYDVAPEGSLLIEGARNYPSQFQNYEYYTYVPISREPREGRLRLVDRPVETLTRWMSNDKYTESYLIITRSQKAQVEMLGILPRGSLDKVERALGDSPNFRILYSNEDASIFVMSDYDLDLGKDKSGD